MTRLAAILATAVTAIFLGVIAWLASGRDIAGLAALLGRGDVSARCGMGVAGGDIGGPFTLIDGQGQTVTDAALLTKPALVYFGYSFCPDVCPLDNARNAEATDILEERGFEVTPVFISVDPARDTPAIMAEYGEMFHPRMVALTGSSEQVAAAEKAYKVYAKVPQSADGFYMVDHSTFTYLMLPGGRFAGFFKRDETADQMAEKASCILNAG